MLQCGVSRGSSREARAIARGFFSRELARTSARFVVNICKCSREPRDHARGLSGSRGPQGSREVLQEGNGGYGQFFYRQTDTQVNPLFGAVKAKPAGYGDASSSNPVGAERLGFVRKDILERHPSWSQTPARATIFEAVHTSDIVACLLANSCHPALLRQGQTRVTQQQGRRNSEQHRGNTEQTRDKHR